MSDHIAECYACGAEVQVRCDEVEKAQVAVERIIESHAAKEAEHKATRAELERLREQVRLEAKANRRHNRRRAAAVGRALRNRAAWRALKAEAARLRAALERITKTPCNDADPCSAGWIACAALAAKEEM